MCVRARVSACVFRPALSCLSLVHQWEGLAAQSRSRVSRGQQSGCQRHSLSPPPPPLPPCPASSLRHPPWFATRTCTRLLGTAQVCTSLCAQGVDVSTGALCSKRPPHRKYPQTPRPVICQQERSQEYMCISACVCVCVWWSQCRQMDPAFFKWFYLLLLSLWLQLLWPHLHAHQDIKKTPKSMIRTWLSSLKRYPNDKNVTS